MGNIRPSFIKIRALRLIERYPDQFTSDFDENKTLVERFTDVDNKKMRNWIAELHNPLQTKESRLITRIIHPINLYPNTWATGTMVQRRIGLTISASF